MPDTYLECPSCGWEGKIEEELVGKRIKCPKCNESFTAEVGGSYDLEEPTSRSTPQSRRAGPPSGSPVADEPKPKKQEADEAKSWLEAWPEE
jgi:hypothetical protein